MAGEEDAAATGVPRPFRLRLEFGNQLLPDLRRFDRRVAGGGDEFLPDAIRLMFVLARVGKHAGEQGQLRDRTGRADTGGTERHAEKLAESGARLGVAQLLEAVAAHVVTDLVTENGRQLRFVVHPQQQAGPHLQHAVGRHRGVEKGRANDIHADIRAMLAGQTASESGHVGVEGFVAQQEAASLQAFLFARQQRPEPALVAARLWPLEACRQHSLAGREQRRCAGQ